MSIPKNAHILSHPCLKAKLSQLRSAKTGSRDAQALVHEIALMVGYEALGAGLKVQEDGTVSRLISFLHVIKDSNACTKVYRPDIYLHQHNNPLHPLYVKSNSKLIY
jgi:uracil phosphoribosyltransferase